MSEEKKNGVRYYWDENTNEIRKFECWVHTDKRSDGSPYIYRFQHKDELGIRWLCYAHLIGRVVRNNSVYYIDGADPGEKFIRELFRLHFNVQACELRKKADTIEKKANSVLTATIIRTV